MLWVPQKGKLRTVTNLPIVGVAYPGTDVNSNATTLLDGAVTEIISAAANDQDSWGIGIRATGNGATNTDSHGCVDILIGGATDDLLIPALIVGGCRDDSGRQYLFPLHIPQGKRIAATHANVRTSTRVNLVVTLFGGSPPPWRVGRKVTAIGTQADNASGQSVTPTASGGAASVTELSASTPEDFFAMVPGFQAQGDTTLGNVTHILGIGVGASVEDRIGTWEIREHSGEGLHGPYPEMPAFQDVPAGSRLTFLASNSGANSAGYGGLIYGVS